MSTRFDDLDEPAPYGALFYAMRILAWLLVTMIVVSMFHAADSSWWTCLEGVLIAIPFLVAAGGDWKQYKVILSCRPPCCCRLCRRPR